MTLHIEEYDRKILALIAEHGWALQGVFPTVSDPGVEFIYTVGLTSYRHPELILYGLPYEMGGVLLNDLGQRVRDGAVFTAGQVISDLLAGDYSVQLIAVTDSTQQITMANRLYADRAPLRALQVVWPDKDNRLPWDDAYSMDRARQPLLGNPPS